MSNASQTQGNREALRLLVAAALAAAAWWFFLAHARWLVGAEPRGVAPAQAIELRVMELPPAPRASETKPVSVGRGDVPAATPRSKPAPSRPPQPAHSSEVHNVSHAKPPSRPVPDTARSTTMAQHDAPAPATPLSKDAPSATNDASSPSETSHAASPSGASGPVNQQARLLSQPLPEVSDDLREQGYQAVAVARFDVHADGTFDVELMKPTQYPRLNQNLLATLRQWRFDPATESGRPVESHQNVRVHFNVN